MKFYEKLLTLQMLLLLLCAVLTNGEKSESPRNSNHNKRRRQLPLPPQFPRPPQQPLEAPQIATGHPHAASVSGDELAVNIADKLRLQGFDVNLLGTRKRVEQTLDDAWNDFKKTFNKVYSSQTEENYRREVFIENTKKIFRMNDDYSRGYMHHAQRINGFADMLHHEFETTLNGFNRSRFEGSNIIPIQKSTTFIPSANVVIPDSIDWRTLGAVTAVRSQGLCAGCYAFSAAGALEGQYYRKTGILNDLSPQNLIDCTKDYGNNGCSGGLMNPAYQYVKDNFGIDTEESYPYEAADNQCRYRPEGFGADCTGFVTIPEGDEEALKVAVSTIGPVSAAIDASRDTLQFYADGVYFDGSCKNASNDMNHAVLVVGYDTEPDGKQYWWVKNSYGPEWGIGGYIKMARNAGNHCGIASLASYPLV